MDKSQHYYMKKCDKIWSEYWHKRKFCEVGTILGFFDCKGPVAAHHLISRGRKATRCLLENGMMLCEFHHTGSAKLSAHKGRQGFESFMQMYYPERWQWVQQHKNKLMKDPDFKGLYNKFKRGCL